MWKYVSRRVRDSVERTYNVLEHRRTWTCGGEKSGPCTNNGTEDVEPAAKQTLCVVPFDDQRGSNGGRSGKRDDDFRRQGGHCQFQQNILGALTWSSALVCGWYTSKILCLRRRNLNDAWSGRCRFSRTLLSPGQAFHTQLLSHWVLTAPADRSKQRYEWHEKFSAKSPPVYAVNNDCGQPLDDSVPEMESKCIDQKSEPLTVKDAVQDLLQVVGDIEFKLGVKHLEDKHFQVAATHFKLGTSHHHVGATFNLGICYELGLGVEKSAKMALECYQIAAEMGHAKALYNVGIYHVRGLGGLSKSRATARHFFIAAARLGQEDAVRALGWRSDGPKKSDNYSAAAIKKQDHHIQPTSDLFQAISLA